MMTRALCGERVIGESNAMHEAVMKEILSDVLAYVRHEGPRDLIDDWSKEMLAFLIADLERDRGLLKQALAEQLKKASA
jgi:hypothetical protein